MKVFKKQEALTIYNKHSKKSDLYLFQEDINKSGSKIFHIISIEKLLKRIELKDSNYYEFWTDKTPLKFSYDIDINLELYPEYRDDKNVEKLLIDLIMTTQKAIKQYFNFDIETNDVIVLVNDEVVQKLENPNKKSYHVIFKSLAFENYITLKYLYKKLDKDFKISDYMTDPAIYNMTCLRLCLNSKFGKKAVLVPKKFKIENTYTAHIQGGCGKEKFNKFFMSTMITYTKNIDKIIILDDFGFQIPKPKSITSNTSYENINLIGILEQLPSKYYDDYHYWTIIGMILNSISTEKNNYYNLWLNWSSKSKKFKEAEMVTKWKSFNSSENNRYSIGTLIKYAKDENITDIYMNKKQEISTIIDEYQIKPIQLNITKSNITEMNSLKLTSDVYADKFNYKLIGISSEKGTGKTSNLFDALFKKKTNKLITKDTTILFVSSRITFGYKLLGDLEKDGFKLYSQITENKINEKRLICQIDSLHRLDIDNYDLVIVDECESLARYITSSHFTKNNRASFIVSLFEMQIENAKQVIILDADLSDRCINYYTNIMNVDKNNNEFHIIKNNYKAFNDYNVDIMNYNSWLKRILVKIENNKKIVIAMASNNKAKDLLTYLKDKFDDKKILLIHKETTEEEKRKLLIDVNKEWIKYDIVIYTPSVCMGVSFDIVNHFDTIFAYGCHESLGAQEFCQMIHRIRYPINKIVNLSIDDYKIFDPAEHLIDYSLMERILCSDYYLTNYNLHNNIVKSKVKLVKHSDLDNGLFIDDEESNKLETKSNKLETEKKIINYNYAIGDKVIYYPYKEEPIYDLFVLNSKEIIEDKLNFSASLIGYIKYKEYKLNYIKPEDDDFSFNNDFKSIRDERVEKEQKELINGIITAPDISTDEFKQKVRQRDEFLTPEDIYKIKRYNFKSCYELNVDLTEELIDKYYKPNIMKWYRNLSTILSNETQDTENKLELIRLNEANNRYISNCYQDFTSKNKYTYHKYPLDIINTLTFDINDLDITVPFLPLEGLLQECMMICENIKYELSFKYDIRLPVTNLIKLETYQQKLKIVNKIISSQYGLIIKKNNNSNNDENIKYKMSPVNDIWNDLPDRNDNFNNLGKKIKIIPIYDSIDINYEFDED
jgi:hypothetical protein